ncbi:MAG: hypothetical protein KCCBMMGE_01855 [Candidatus Methanoperedenaceae archaeon GB37]|nr:MAG: hypothetical protein KCCBMMGE_01855 [Candidatus Methanoperedenaceae archaeon GB37]
MGLLIETPLPHGGRLVERVVTDPELGKKMAKMAKAVYDIKPTLHYETGVASKKCL